jgi:hypothetical protein
MSVAQPMKFADASTLGPRIEANDLYRLVFDASPLPMWLMDAETLAYLAVNDAMTRLHGYSREELLGMTLCDIKIPEELEQTRANVARLRAGDIRRVPGRRERRKDGSLVELDITNHALSLEGRLVVLCIGVDVTETRHLEEQLRQAQKMEAIGQLAGGIAHDFNNILAVILGNAEFAAEDLDPNHPSVAELREIEAAAERGATLTRQLLAFSRKQPRQQRPVALNSVVTGLEAMMCRLVGERIAMSAHLSPKLGTISADVHQLEQVLVNLIVNARDAMPDGGTLTLATSNVDLDAAAAAALGVEPGPYATLAVTDTGTGIEPAVQARMFEPFFTTKEVGKGTGLGLATVFGIVKQNGAGIAVESTPGHGATFRIYFPRLDRPAPAESAIGTVREAPMRGTETIMLVEDDAVLRRAIRRQLAGWGYQIVEASDGAAAVALAAMHRIDLLLTDVVMPGIDGRTLAAQLPQLKVVFMSGYTEHATIKASSLGPDDHFVHKPFTSAVLSRAIRRALESGSRSD